ncbi:MAG: immune inhibitor A [Halioglobus sp.]
MRVLILKNAWANIESVGWRKIDGVSPNGVTNMFALLNEARANNKMVNAKMGNNNIHIAYLN